MALALTAFVHALLCCPACSARAQQRPAPALSLARSGLAQRGTVSLQKEGIEIRGFNSFKVKFYNGYKGRNPKTGDPIKVDGKKLPFFKVGKELRERVDR